MKFNLGDTPRFFSKHVEGNGPDGITGCWNWTGSKKPLGYGLLHRLGKTFRAHRWAWEFFCGPVKEGLELDHLCRNPSCVNPEHLEPVTHAVNVARGESPCAKHTRQETCINGHPFTGTNLYAYKSGWRACKKCRAARLRTYRRQKRLSALSEEEAGK